MYQTIRIWGGVLKHSLHDTFSHVNPCTQEDRIILQTAISRGYYYRAFDIEIGTGEAHVVSP